MLLEDALYKFIYVLCDTQAIKHRESVSSPLSVVAGPWIDTNNEARVVCKPRRIKHCPGGEGRFPSRQQFISIPGRASTLTLHCPPSPSLSVATAQICTTSCGADYPHATDFCRDQTRREADGDGPRIRWDGGGAQVSRSSIPTPQTPENRSIMTAHTPPGERGKRRVQREGETEALRQPRDLAFGKCPGVSHRFHDGGVGVEADQGPERGLCCYRRACQDQGSIPKVLT
ncbi:hypothetical protein F5Y15DRAFT_221569 [Xylariaceae sp. FL0016]|nr:hypothetical protein F5Y15DRAFT_221569 [Xylariaceae sp. FL0016]